MKVKKKSKNIVFEPIVIEVTIESEGELKALWNALNASPAELSDKSKEYGSHPIGTDEVHETTSLWSAIDDEL